MYVQRELRSMTRSKNMPFLSFLSSFSWRNARPSQQILILLACPMLLAGCAYFFLRNDNSVPVVANQTQAALTVTTAEVQEKMWASVIKASGAILPWQEAIIGAQLTGLQLIEVSADVGDNVKRGQVLARFDADMLIAEREQLLATVAQAQALATQASVDHKRAKQLKPGGGISAQNLLAAATQAETTAAQLAMVQAQLTTNSLQLHYIEVRAPDDGIISARSATLGTVGAIGQELFRMIRAGRLEWQGELTAQQVTQVAIGQQVTLELPDGSNASARIRQIAPSMDAQSRLLTVYAALAHGSQARAGMFVNGIVTLEQKTARVVPAASVIIRDGHSYVFLLNEDSLTVAQRAVQVGRRDADTVAIISDLAPGDAVVVQGAGFLNDGDQVRIAPAIAAANASTVLARGLDE
jgi:RND family efflux transporter MFP subunit